MIAPAALTLFLLPLQDRAPTGALVPPARYVWQDVDRDGHRDVYVLTPGREDRLLLHVRGAFEDVTERFGLGGLESTIAVTWTDFEQDGLPDLHVVALDGGSRLFHNAGTGFVDVTASSGVAHDGPAMFHEWFDVDADDLPELHVVTPEADVLFKNLGSSRFTAIPLPTSRAIGPGLSAPGEAEPAEDVQPPGAPAPERGGRRSAAEARPGRIALPPGGGTEELGACGTTNIDDAGAPGCLQASSVPTLGMLYPLSTNLNVDGTGRVGIGTSTPTDKLDVDGTIRSRAGGFEFPDGSLQATAQSLDSSFAYGAGSDPTATLQFLAPPATVTVLAGQKVSVNSHKAFGSRYTQGACCLSLWVGYRLSPGGAISVLGGGILGNKVNRNIRTILGINGILSTLPPGTYEVGMVGGSSDPHWDFNGAGYTSALVFD